MTSAVAELESRSSHPVPHDAAMTLIDFYLLEQQELTAVERFARHHEDGASESVVRRYSSLLPVTPPRDGEQYAFDVDLDACSGCKACVTACHQLNGLAENETWRDVGLLHGGSEEDPFLQHVTAACHHCLDPACLSGCPVQAYEKDATTGIVHHLDDQCIGCQYCIFACPYDVPKYDKARGIVRKCDLCSQRLAVGEAPACVQACPNSAIRVTTIRRQEVIDNCETGVFLPGAPDPRQTRPATHYRTRRVIPRNVLPADYFSVRPEHAHWPLIVMLVLTQLSVGAFVVELLLVSFAPRLTLAPVRSVQAVGALASGLLALAASTLHLGRPLYAYRAIVGLRTSWLSREIVAFGLFAGLATIYAGLSWTDSAALAEWQAALGIAVVVTGLAGVVCSILIYQCTGRELWSGARTSWRFLLTTVVLGISASLLLSLIGGTWAASLTTADVLRDYGRTLARALMVAAGTKLLGEALVFVHLRDRLHTLLKRSALLLTGDLSRFTFWRYLLGSIGGLLLPWWLLNDAATLEGTAAWPALLIAGASFACLLAGELLERYLFFTAVATPRMPGGLRS